MQWIAPTSDTATLDLLSECLRQLQIIDQPTPLNDPQLAEQLTTLLAQYQTTHTDLMRARRQHQFDQADCKASEHALRMRLRDAFQLVRRQKRNPQFPGSLFEAFGLRVDGRQTRMTHRLLAPIQVAHRVVAAERMAQADGYHLLTDPTPATLTHLAEQLGAHKQSLVVSQNRERLVLRDMRGLRKQASYMFLRIRTLARLATLGKGRAAHQSMLQDFGFAYRKCSAAVPATTLDAVATEAEGQTDTFSTEQSDKTEHINGAESADGVGADPANSSNQTDTDGEAKANREDPTNAPNPAHALQAANPIAPEPANVPQAAKSAVHEHIADAQLTGQQVSLAATSEPTHHDLPAAQHQEPQPMQPPGPVDPLRRPVDPALRQRVVQRQKSLPCLPTLNLGMDHARLLGNGTKVHA